jgi:hypothetical protein
MRALVEVLDKGLPLLFEECPKNKIEVNVDRARRFLGLLRLRNPEESLRGIVESALGRSTCEESPSQSI